MSAQDRTEQVLRKFHILFSKAEAVNGSARDVVIDKIEAMELLQELNDCMYEMLDESGLSRVKRDKANRDMQKKGDEIIFSATRKAEDVYAASIMFTDNALREIQNVVGKTLDDLDRSYRASRQKLLDEQRSIRQNQMDLKTQLESMIDTQKYISLIEEDRRQQAKAAKENGEEAAEEEENIYAGRQSEVRINKEYFIQQGIAFDDLDELNDELGGESSDESNEEKIEELIEETNDKQGSEEVPPAPEKPTSHWRSVDDIQQALLSNELDEEYFSWQEEQNPPKPQEKKHFTFFGKK